jgi:serpin B
MKVLFILSAILLNALIVNSTFQSSIFSEVNPDFKGKNVILSPLSIFQVLGLTTNGAVGTTQKEMISTLESSTLDNLNNINLKIIEKIKKFVTVELANGVMSRFDPIKTFSKVCDKYEAPIEKLVSKKQVNDWCSKNTHGKITEIIDELSPATLMLLLNAVYFRGEWVSPFNPDNTRGGIFYNFGKEEKKVEIMTQTHEFNYYQDSQIQAVELPYKNDSMSALIILPNKDIDINNYINNKNVNDDLVKKIDNGMKSTYVKLSLPKFEVGFYSKLKDVLRRLKMEIPFTGAADFSGINGSGGLYIDDVIHKTYLKVDEIGSEAAGVTVVDMRKGIPSSKVVGMEVNRPFIVILRSSELPINNEFLFVAKIEEISDVPK